MKKNAFTLIELLAVIVILAIIALIAVPIVLNIISDTKKSSDKESIKLYLDTVEKTIAKRQMEKPNFNPTECKINNDETVTCGEETIKIEIKGDIPKSGTIKFGKGMIISGVNIDLNNLYYQVTNGKISEGTKEKIYRTYITKENDLSPTGLSRGDKYTYEVNDKDIFTFYVLSIEGDKVHLIMDRNICGYLDSTNSDNGKATTDVRTCFIAWYSTTGDNSNGPITAMQGIYNATKNWTNVPDMDLSGNNKYSDEGHEADSSYGYGTIETTKLGIKITKKDKTTEVTREGNLTPVILYEENKPLKARFPKLKEVYNTDTSDTTYCHNNGGICPAWLTNGLRKHPTLYPENEHISGINGYWLLSSVPGGSSGGRIVSDSGYIDNFYSNVSGRGIRPVITVSKDDLS